MLSLSTIEEYPEYKKATIKVAGALKNSPLSGIFKIKDSRLKVSIDSTYQAALDIQISRFNLRGLPIPWKASLEIINFKTTWVYNFQPFTLNSVDSQLQEYVSQLRKLNKTTVLVDNKKSTITISTEIQGVEESLGKAPLKYSGKSFSDKIFMPNTLIWSQIKNIYSSIISEIQMFSNAELSHKEKISEDRISLEIGGYSSNILIDTTKFDKANRNDLSESIIYNLESSRMGKHLQIFKNKSDISISLQPFTFERLTNLSKEIEIFEYEPEEVIAERLEKDETSATLGAISENYTTPEQKIYLEILKQLFKKQGLIQLLENPELVKEETIEPYLEDDVTVQKLLVLPTEKMLEYLEDSYILNKGLDKPIDSIIDVEVIDVISEAMYNNPIAYLKGLKRETAISERKVNKILGEGNEKKKEKLKEKYLKEVNNSPTKREEFKNKKVEEKRRKKEKIIKVKKDVEDKKKKNLDSYEKRKEELRIIRKKELDDERERDLINDEKRRQQELDNEAPSDAFSFGDDLEDGKVFDDSTGMYLPKSDLSGTPYENMGNDLELDDTEYKPEDDKKEGRG